MRFHQAVSFTELVLPGGTAVGLMVVCAPFVTPALRRVCLPYVPATTSQVNNVLLALRGRHGSLLDLGSGDGRIVRLPEFFIIYFLIVSSLTLYYYQPTLLLVFSNCLNVIYYIGVKKQRLFLDILWPLTMFSITEKIT